MFPLREDTCQITVGLLLKMESLLRSSSFSGSALKALAMALTACEASTEETFVAEVVDVAADVLLVEEVAQKDVKE